MNSNRGRLTSRPHAAFTLVELLIVVAIIGVLISLLLPSLDAAKGQARKTVCLGNLRQQGVAFAMYADAYKEVVPLGYTSNNQFNYMIYLNAGTNCRPLLLGLLQLSGLIKPYNPYFCPSIGGAFGYDDPLNLCPVWPVPTTGSNLRCGYVTRPALNSTVPSAWAWGFSSNAWRPTNWPKRRQVAGLAIVSDLNTWGYFSANAVHKDGQNALYENGSAHWFPVSALDAAGLESIPVPLGAGSAGIHAIWAATDKN